MRLPRVWQGQPSNNRDQLGMAAFGVCYETPGSFLKERSLRGAFFVFGGWIGSGWVELAGELHRPEDFDHPFEVVSHDGEADFGLRAASSAQQ